MQTEIIIIGAGAAGLMAARELAKAGKKVMILEARERIGGRIWPLDDGEFGYQAQAGAEFVHGPAKVTKELIAEAGLTFVPMEGEIWSIRGGSPVQAEEFMTYRETISEKLKELTEDTPILSFLDKYFVGEEHGALRNSIIKMVEGYDAADPTKISTFALREEWLGHGQWQQGRIKEGYRALLNFLAAECKKNQVQIILDKKVIAIDVSTDTSIIRCEDGQEYQAEKVITTLPLPVLATLQYHPAIPEKLAAADKIGFGSVIKIILRFKDQWWFKTLGQDFSKLMFMLSNETVPTWWTQYPAQYPVLMGWFAGPRTEKYKNVVDGEILNLALSSLASIFQVKQAFLREQLTHHRIVNWSADPFARGAYSYSTPESRQAQAELVRPVNDKLFFAGEALYSGQETATTEGALASGKEVAGRILNIQL